MTHDDIMDAIRRLVEAGVAAPRASDIGDISLCAEIVNQGLARQIGSRLVLTGNGWHTGRQWWPAWLQPTIDALIDTIVTSDVEVLAMDDVALRTLVKLDAGYEQLRPESAGTNIAWRVIVHACAGCTKQCGQPPDGKITLNERGFRREQWHELLNQPPWELLPIGGGS